MPKPFDLTVREVEPVKTEHRRIQTPLPVPDSVPTLERLFEHEPRSMQGQPPLIWDHAEDFHVHDPYGNKWLDFSSGVLVTNAGHSPEPVRRAVAEKAESGHLFSYYFPTEVRADLVENLSSLAPSPLDKAYLLTTGAETTEAAMKMAKTWARREHGPDKRWIVHFERAFHGRTMGAQLAGGDSDAKDWIGPHDGFLEAPFPDEFRTEETSFDAFEQAIDDAGREPSEIAAVIFEPYQGGGASFLPDAYVQSLRDWCDEHDVVLIADEVQSGFGRTGRMFAFEHYDIVPDLVCCGKGVSGSMPLSAVLGPPELLDQFEPGSMSSTHGGHPVSCAAAVANLDLLDDELLTSVRENGASFGDRLQELADTYPERVGTVHGRGYVWGIHVTEPGSKQPDGDTAARIVQQCFHRGLLMFAPVGPGHATIKIAPPLVASEAALQEGADVLETAFDAVLGGSDDA